MTKENQDIFLQGSKPTAEDLFVKTQISHDLSDASDLFTGDTSFLRDPALIEHTRRENRTARRLSWMQSAIIACIILIASLLLWSGLTHNSPAQTTNFDAENQQITVEKTHKTSTIPVAGELEKEPALTNPISLHIAEQFFLSGEYEQAAKIYEILITQSEPFVRQQALRGFMRFRIAVCREQLGELDECIELLKSLVTSEWPAVKFAASYKLTLQEINSRQYLKARARAYQTLALIDSLGFDKKFAEQTQQICRFLAAETVTRQIFALTGTKSPPLLWTGKVDIDPFTGKTEDELKAFLESGHQKLAKASLEPKIDSIDGQGEEAVFSALVNNAPLDEVLSRIASSSSIKMAWADNVESGFRKRAIQMSVDSALAVDLMETTAGAAGLAATRTQEAGILISGVDQFNTLEAQVQFLQEEAAHLWRRYILWYPTDSKTSKALFALAMIYSDQNMIPEALAQYKLLVGRFAASGLAPYALLNSSKLNTDLKDYSGAKNDLQQLVEQYPDAGYIESAYMGLAQNTAASGIYDEAAKLYAKVFHMSISPASQMTAALEAGRACYKAGDEDGAVSWLERHVEMAGPGGVDADWDAMLLLGESYGISGRPQRACDILWQAASKARSKNQCTKAIKPLVENCLIMQDYFRALAALDEMPTWSFSRDEYIELSLLRSKVLRAIGLLEQAAAAIAEAANYASSPDLKASILMEVAACSRQAGDVKTARENLSKVIVLDAKKEIIDLATLELADVCLTLGRSDQALTACKRLLDEGCDQQIKRSALEIVAKVYDTQGDYGKAALALVGNYEAIK